MENHNKVQQSKNRVHISWGILYTYRSLLIVTQNSQYLTHDFQIHCFQQIIFYFDTYFSSSLFQLFQLTVNQHYFCGINLVQNR